MVTDLDEHVPVRIRERPRLAGLDGLRGLAALYVLFDHCWLLTYPGFPHDNGPWWLGWLMFGHLAVVFFLVVSGFSLGAGPARSGWRLGSTARYARRRAWRLLPPYWAGPAPSEKPETTRKKTTARCPNSSQPSHHGPLSCGNPAYVSSQQWPNKT